MLSFLTFFILMSVISCSDIFHTKSVITFKPDKEASYFGFSVLLGPAGVHVGAPKASSRVNRSMSKGLVFKCPLNLNLLNLNFTNNIICEPSDEITDNNPNLPYDDDGWYGATIAAMPDGKILACAPRMKKKVGFYKESERMTGECYLSSNRIGAALLSFDNGKNGYHAKGMSVKVADNNHILIGVPGQGVLESTDDFEETLLHLQYIPTTSQFTSNSCKLPKYSTAHLDDDVYIGYSVETGIFKKNGSILYVAGAPRSTVYGQVIVYDPEKCRSFHSQMEAILKGPQYGSYFGASLCAVDLNGDGLSDLLVGAPNYVISETAYDQGAVFVYMSTHTVKKVRLKLSVAVRGSATSGAKFGTSIAELGDINSDKYNDVAISAPWEDEGKGVVYIYEGYADGLKIQYSQRIQAEGAKGFGISISKGFDVDGNKLNDFAVGAYGSDTAYLYRSVPSFQVMATIRVLDAQKLNLHTENFTAKFCFSVSSNQFSPGMDTQRDLKATILIDREYIRSKLSDRVTAVGATEYTVTAKSGHPDACHELVLKVNKSSDFTKPISIKFNLEPYSNIDNLDDFPRGIARLTKESILHPSPVYVQLADCGQDLICKPWLEVTLVSFNSPHVPGDGKPVGAKVKVVNTGESAYSVRLHVTLPSGLKKLPHSCSIYNLDLYCNLPLPLHANHSEQWDIELDYQWDGQHDELNLMARVEDMLHSRNITGAEKTLRIPITPKSAYTFSRRIEPNRTVTILRDTFDYEKDVIIKHIYEVHNKGPSALYQVNVTMILPEEFTLPAEELGGKVLYGNELNFGISAILAHEKSSFVLPLRFNYSFAEKMEEKLGLNITSKAYFNIKNYYKSVGENKTETLTTTVLLEPKSYLILYNSIGTLIGMTVLAVIVRILHKFGFFTRKTKEQLLSAAEEDASADEPGTSLGEATTNPKINENFENIEEVK